MLLSTYCNPPLSWTSQWQQLQEVYTTSCASLGLKPNTHAQRYLYALAGTFEHPGVVKTMDASPFFLGRRGALPLMSAVRLCLSMETLSLAENGIDDFACHSICAALAEHPSICALDLRGNAFTGESVEFLHKLANCWSSREGRREGKVPRRISILVSEGLGISSASCKELSDWVQTREESQWGYAAVTRPKISLLEKRERAQNSKYSLEFGSDVSLMRQRLLISEYLSSRVPTGRLQFSPDRWLIVTVFISSAFNEFHDEANLIHRIIFPRANWKLRSFRVHLVPVMLHSTLDEYYQPAATVQADGREPIDYTRLPAYRKGARAFAEDRAGRRHGVLFSEEGAHSSEVRALMIDNCDAFVGLFSDIYDEAISRNDFYCAKELGIPIFGFKRRASGVPAEIAHLHDYRRALEIQKAAHNINLSGRSFGVRDSNTIKKEVDEALSKFAEFEKNVRSFCGRAFCDYDAPYSRSYLGGERRFDIDELFVQNFIVNMVALGHCYLARREGGSAPNGNVFDVSEVQSKASRHIPSIPCMKFGEGPSSSHFVKSLISTVVAPFKSEDEVLREKHGIMNQAGEGVGVGLNLTDVVTPMVIERPFCAIIGEPGTGKTTQLRAIAASIGQDGLASIAKHSVIHSKATLFSTMVGILQQFYRKYTDVGGSVFESFVAPGATEEELVTAFCKSLREAPMVNEYSNRICIFIDDDDFSDQSFVKIFLQNPKYFDMLQQSTPSLECKVQIFFTANSIQGFSAPDALLSTFPVPDFSEEEAASLFFYLTVGLGNTHLNLTDKAKEAAKRVAYTKRHGTRPLYIYLAAREVAYYLESTPIEAIVDVLPETVEEIAATAMKVALPPDLECFFEALATAAEPFTGAMLRFAMNNYRQYPYFTEKTAEKYRWTTPRTWGRITEPLPSSAGTISICNANFCHLFEHSLRSEGSGFLTNRWSRTKYNVWRHPWRFMHRTVLEAARRIFNSGSRPNAPATPISEQVWGRPLRRLAYIRDGPFTTRALSNIVDPRFILSTPHRIFAMFNGKCYDEVAILLRELAFMVTSGSEEERLLGAWGQYCGQFWPILKRHRGFFYACPHDAPLPLQDLLSKSFGRNMCAHIEREQSIQLGLPSSVSQTVLKTSLCNSVCAAYRTLANVRSHEVTSSIVAGDRSNGFGRVHVFGTGSSPLVYEPHTNAICSMEILVSESNVRIATAAFFEAKVQLATVGEGSIVIVSSIGLDFVLRSPLRMSLSAWNSTLLQRTAHISDFPMVAYADRNALIVTERRGLDHAPRSHRFEGHDSPVAVCGFSPAGCKVFSIDASGQCILWGAPETPFAGTIIAVTSFKSIPRSAHLVDPVTFLYITGEGVFTWNAETSHVNSLAPFVSKGEVSGHYAVLYDDGSSVPSGVACMVPSQRLVKWYGRPGIDEPFVDCTDYLRIQDHSSTADAIGNREPSGWRWKFGRDVALGYDTRENILKIFSRGASRQVPLFFALPDANYKAPSRYDDAPKDSEGVEIPIPVFRSIRDFSFAGTMKDSLIAVDDFGALYVLRIVNGPLVYPSDPTTLE